MKKLKLKKETIVLLSNNESKKIAGGEQTGDNSCNPTCNRSCNLSCQACQSVLIQCQ